MDPNKYALAEGTVQAYVYKHGDGNTPMFLYHFGRPEYDSNRPILSASLKDQAQPIINSLNQKLITETEAKEQLKKIWL